VDHKRPAAEASHAAWRTGPYRLILVIAAAQTHFCCNAVMPSGCSPGSAPAYQFALQMQNSETARVLQVRQGADRSSSCDFTRGCMSECILKLREMVGAAIDPHGLVTLLWTLVVHAGEARERSRDLAAFDPVSVPSTADCRSSVDMRSIAAFVGSHMSRCLGREGWHKQWSRQNACDLPVLPSLSLSRKEACAFVKGRLRLESGYFRITQTFGALALWLDKADIARGHGNAGNFCIDGGG
jgi:hypothetical protein